MPPGRVPVARVHHRVGEQSGEEARFVRLEMDALTLWEVRRNLREARMPHGQGILVLRCVPAPGPGRRHRTADLGEAYAPRGQAVPQDFIRQSVDVLLRPDDAQ